LSRGNHGRAVAQKDHWPLARLNIINGNPIHLDIMMREAAGIMNVAHRLSAEH
jgi:hypothetical protein